MGWMRDNRDALVITVIGGMLVTVGGGVVLTNVLPGSDGSGEPLVVQTPQAAKPTIITVKVPTPPSPKAAAAKKKASPPQPKPQPPPSPPPPVATPPPATPPPAATPASPSPPAAQTGKVVTTAAGTVVPEGARVKLLDGRLVVGVGNVAGAVVARVRLLAKGRACAFTAVGAGEILGVRVSRRAAVGVKVVAVTAKGATLKAAASRAPRGSELCLRGGA